MLQAKVKLVADAIWARLSGAFSKDILHGQVSCCCSAPTTQGAPAVPGGICEGELRPLPSMAHQLYLALSRFTVFTT